MLIFFLKKKKERGREEESKAQGQPPWPAPSRATQKPPCCLSTTGLLSDPFIAAPPISPSDHPSRLGPAGAWPGLTPAHLPRHTGPRLSATASRTSLPRTPQTPWVRSRGTTQPSGLARWPCDTSLPRCAALILWTAWTLGLPCTAPGPAVGCP